MPPPIKKKMTAQPVRTRHFVGKHIVEEPEESSSESESESEQEKPPPQPKPRPAPFVSTFPKAVPKDNDSARQRAQAEQKRLEEDFETESEDEAEGSGSESGSEEDESEEEESSSEEEARPRFQRPVFIKKNQRAQTTAPVKPADEIAAEEEKRKQEQTKALVQGQIEQRAAEKAARRRDWDDDVEEADMAAVDDTDGIDPEAEYAAWKLREFKRIRRERQAIEEGEAELAELERRRNLTEAEREAEDRAFLEKQEEERGDRGDMQFMQKYFHKGAFYQEDLKELGVDRRNVMGATFQDSTNRELLPEYMQIRDMTKLGKKGRTRYKDMKTEDTGMWGDFGDHRRSRGANDHGLDDRFKADSFRGGRHDDGEGATGANAKPLGERKRFGEDSSRETKRPRVEDR